MTPIGLKKSDKVHSYLVIIITRDLKKQISHQIYSLTHSISLSLSSFPFMIFLTSPPHGLQAKPNQTKREKEKTHVWLKVDSSQPSQIEIVQ